MKILPFIPLAVLLILCSCSARKRETPAILEGKKIDVSSIYKKRGADLVDALYEEVVSNSEQLKKLEQEIKQLKATFPDSLEDFKTYHEKNARYYESAEKKANAITDSVLRNSILNMIKESRGNYRDSIATHSNLDSLISKRAATIDNLHNLLKLMLTLPVIEEFQLSNRPDTFDAASLTQRLDAVILQLDSLTQQLRPKPTITPAEKK
jgi:hypothetical protein